MQWLIDLATTSPLCAFVLICSAYYLAKAILWMPYNFYKRWCRHRAIMMHGWPTAPIDADGDVIYDEPKRTTEATTMPAIATPLPADQEAELLKVIKRSICNAREIDMNEDAAERLAWIVYNAMLQNGWSIR